MFMVLLTHLLLCLFVHKIFGYFCNIYIYIYICIYIYEWLYAMQIQWPYAQRWMIIYIYIYMYTYIYIQLYILCMMFLCFNIDQCVYPYYEIRRTSCSHRSAHPDRYAFAPGHNSLHEPQGSLAIHPKKGYHRGIGRAL